jgi:hypothetical protein
MKRWEARRERLESEMQAHIELETQENIDAGMSPLEARQAAMRKFGSVVLAGDQSREAWGWLWLERLWQDVRFALRSFRKNAGFTVVALLSGIGCVVIDLAQPMIRFVTHQIQFVSWTIERRLAIMRTTLREMTRENLTKT